MLVKLAILAISVIILVVLIKNSLKAKPKAIDATDMARDPVCNTYISMDGVFKLKYNNKLYHFCSKECMNKFREEKLKEVNSEDIS
ncbi:MAG: YHS domain-containing protein [Deferribacteraceae bacterium]|jgi:YHS domain-containing protein|nr:YHS domain-containing protein [Deferribacteraceae bacterium]